MGTPENRMPPDPISKKWEWEENDKIKKIDSKLSTSDLESRAEKIKEKVEKQYKIYKLKSNSPDNNMMEVVDEANLLLSTYGPSENIPEEELLRSGHDDARMLALCRIIETEKEPTYH